MKKKDLRQQAEEKLGKQKSVASLKMETDALWSIHELQLHQIELEMQNEELMNSRAETEAALRQYTDLYDFAPVGYFTFTCDGTISMSNLTGATLLGVERGKLLMQRFGLFVDPKSRPVFAAFLERVFSASGKKQTCEVELLKGETESLWGQIEAASDDAREACRAVVVDVSGRKRAEEALRESEDKFKYFFDHSAIGKSLTYPSGEVNVNQSLGDMLGYTLTELKNKKWQEITHAEDIELTQRKIDQLLSGKQNSMRFIKRFIHKDGSVVWVDLSSSRRLDVDGKPLYLMTSMIDITERRQAEEALKHFSTHDELTGLYNRSFFAAEMTRLEHGREFPVSIVMADVNGLKKTNDREGHAAGDSLLKRIAQVLTTAFRSEDVIARMGGDEFAVLLPVTGAASAKILLERVRQVIDDNNTAHAEAHLSLSLGVSTTENPIPLSVVLQKADVNMYREKRGNDDS